MTGPDPAPDALGERPKEILQLLQSGEYDAQEIGDRIGITASTVQDHIATLRNAGFTIHGSRDPDKGYALESDFGDDYSAVISDLKSGVTYADLADKYDLTRPSARRLLDTLRERGHTIDHKTVDQDGTRLFYLPDETDKPHRVGDGDGHYTFALISDTHLGSEATHLDELHDFYDRLEDRGVSNVFHAGDISDGWDVHKGHVNVIRGEASGWGRLKEYVIENYPQREGVTTHFIEGNHDHKYHRKNGIHFGQLIAGERDDLVFCGDSQARFIFDHDIDLELIHPSGGQPYTKGYRIQTLYRERPIEDRPTIAGVGHLHGKLYASAEGVDHGFYTGCWKGLTTYGKRKGHDAQIGGWIVDMRVEGGHVREFTPQWVGYEHRGDANRYDVQELGAG